VPIEQLYGRRHYSFAFSVAVKERCTWSLDVGKPGTGDATLSGQIRFGRVPACTLNRNQSSFRSHTCGLPKKSLHRLHWRELADSPKSHFTALGAVRIRQPHTFSRLSSRQNSLYCENAHVPICQRQTCAGRPLDCSPVRC
jgi:hypothetical protein